MTSTQQMTESEIQDQNDVDLLRGLAACHLSYGGTAAARELLELARMIKPNDGPTLVLLARAQAQSGDLVRAATLMAEATGLIGKLSSVDLNFARYLRERLERAAKFAST